MQSEEVGEPECSYPPSSGPAVAINGLLLVLIVVLLVAASGSNGWGGVFSILLLLGLGALLNLLLAATSTDGRGVYAAAATWYGVLSFMLLSAIRI